MTVESGVYTLREAIERLGIGQTLGRRLAREGRFPGCFRLGNRYLVSKAVIDRLVETGSLSDLDF